VQWEVFVGGVEGTWRKRGIEREEEIERDREI
jgi:hypothetical protein